MIKLFMVSVIYNIVLIILYYLILTQLYNLIIIEGIKLLYHMVFDVFTTYMKITGEQKEN
jgi:hypothetical protein